MSLLSQQATEGSPSESVQFPPTNTFYSHQARMAMAPPLSSASRAPSRPPYQHEDERGDLHCMRGGFERPECDYSMHRHSYSDHLGLHSGPLIEHILLQENQKALRMASLVQSQASGCLSGCLCCGMNEKRLRFKDHEDRMLEEQRWSSWNGGGGPSKSANVGIGLEDDDSADRWFRQPRPRQPHGGIEEGAQGRPELFPGEEPAHPWYQGRQSSYPSAQAGYHMQEHQVRSVGRTDSSVPVHACSDGDGRVRPRWSNQRQTFSGNLSEGEGRQTISKSGSRVGLPSAGDQDRRTSLSMPGTATRSLSRNLGRNSLGLVGEGSIPLPQTTRSSSQSRPGLRENSLEFSYQENVLQQADTQRVVTQGPVSLTNWYLIKVQDGEVGRVLETGVAVGGCLLDNQERVKTAPIANRLDFRKVVTEDGVEVSLQGSMDQATSTTNGFPAGIVQCFSTGFPYLWKQYMRVKTVGEPSSMAVSGSLGRLDANTSKAVSEREILSSSRDCEGNEGDSAPGIPASVDEEPLKSQSHVNIATETVETVMVETAAVNKVNIGCVDNLENAIEKQIGDDRLNSPDPAPKPGLSVANADPEFLVSEGEDGFLTLNLVTSTVKSQKGRKNKKGSVQPVRSSRRLQQLKLGSTQSNARDTPELATSTHQVEKGSSDSELDAPNSKEGEANVIDPDMDQVTMEGEKVTTTMDADKGPYPVEESKSVDLEAAGQAAADSADVLLDLQPMEVEQELEHAPSYVEKVSEETEVVKSPRKEVDEVPLNSEESEDSAPITPPQPITTRARRKRKTLDTPAPGEVTQQACLERVSIEFCAPITRSLKRLRRLCDGEGPSTGPASKPDTPHPKNKPRTALVRARQPEAGSKKVSCSRCEQPISPRNLEINFHGKDVSNKFQQSGDTVQKVEPQEYAPLTSHHSGETLGSPEQPHGIKSESPAVKRRLSRAKEKETKPASRRPEKKEPARRPKAEAAGQGSSESYKLEQNGRRRSMIPPPLPPPRVQDKSKVPEAFGLKTSRSGRLLVPPLAYWRSQSIGYDMDGGIIAIFEGFEAKPADTGCFTFTPPQEEHAKKIQKQLCKAAITVTKRKQFTRR